MHPECHIADCRVAPADAVVILRSLDDATGTIALNGCRVIRPPAAPAASRLENAMAEAGGAGGQDPLALSGPTSAPAPAKPNYHQSVAMARNTAVEQPVRAAYVVKNWIAADG